MTTSTPQSEHKGYFVFYKGDKFGYFVHAPDPAKAKWQIVNRMHRKRGFTTARAHRVPELDDHPITYDLLRNMGYQLKTPPFDVRVMYEMPICTCTMCLEQFHATQKDFKSD